MIMHQTNDKSSINSDSKEKKPVEICNNNIKKKKPEKKEQEPSETHTRDDDRNKSKKGFMNTLISKGRIFRKRCIKTSIMNEKQQNNRYQGLDNNTSNDKRINNNNMIVSRKS